MSKIQLFQLLKCEDLMLLSVFHYMKPNIFGVWKILIWSLGNYEGETYYYSLTFYKPSD